MRRLASLSHRHAAPAAGAFAISLLLATAAGAAARIVPANYFETSSTTVVADNSSGAAAVTCPAGDLVVTGGAYWHRRNAISDMTLYTTLDSSAPKTDASGWYANGSNHSGSTLELTAVAQCLPKKSLGAYTLLKREVIVDPSLPGNANLRCKVGQQVVAGGAVWHRPGQKPKPGLFTLITNSAPFGKTGWLTTGRNQGVLNLSLDMRVIALCVPVAILGGGYGTPSISSIAVGHVPDPVEHYQYCPTGKHVVAGGANWGYPGGTIDTDSGNVIESSSVTADGTGWYASGRRIDPRHNETSATFTVMAYCI